MLIRRTKLFVSLSINFGFSEFLFAVKHAKCTGVFFFERIKMHRFVFHVFSVMCFNVCKLFILSCINFGLNLVMNYGSAVDGVSVHYLRLISRLG